jgi:hypothetical protein
MARRTRPRGASRMESEVTGSGNPDTGKRALGGSLNDSPGAATPITVDGSTEEVRSQRDLVEAQQNDRANAQSNRTNVYDYRDDTQWQVNPNQTPKPTKTIRPIPSV